MLKLFHVTKAENVPSIRRKGLVPTMPVDMKGEPSAVYLFKDLTALEDAVMNWLGDRFEEDDSLVVITLSDEGVEVLPTDAGFEVVSYDSIPPGNILSVDEI